MNDYEPRESYFAFKQFMAAVKRDLELGQGAIQPATVKWAEADETKTKMKPLTRVDRLRLLAWAGSTAATGKG